MTANPLFFVCQGCRALAFFSFSPKCKKNCALGMRTHMFRIVGIKI